MKDRTFDLAFAGWFLFCTLLSLAMLAGIGWAIYRIVVWLTAQTL